MRPGYGMSQISRVQAVDMSYLCSAYIVDKVDRESNENMYGRLHRSNTGERVRWFDYQKRMGE